MDDDHALVSELKRLNERISQLEEELNMVPPNDPLRVGDRLELQLMRHQQALVQTLTEEDGDLEAALQTCRRRLREAERRHAELNASGRAHDLRHADEWWDTEDQIDYLADLIRRLETELQPYGR